MQGRTHPPCSPHGRQARPRTTCPSAQRNVRLSSNAPALRQPRGKDGRIIEHAPRAGALRLRAHRCRCPHIIDHCHGPPPVPSLASWHLRRTVREVGSRACDSARSILQQSNGGARVRRALGLPSDARMWKGQCGAALLVAASPKWPPCGNKAWQTLQSRSHTHAQSPISSPSPERSGPPENWRDICTSWYKQKRTKRRLSTDPATRSRVVGGKKASVKLRHLAHPVPRPRR